MATTLSQTDARAIERAARTVPGVAFAEVSAAGEGQVVLRLWVWHDARQEETAGNVEVALRELGVDVATGDVRVAGVAKALPALESEAGVVRVIDLGEGTWATETVEPVLPPLLPPPVETPVAGRSLVVGPSLVAVTVTRGRGTCVARVEVERADGAAFTGEASGPDSAARVRLAVSEAAAAAAGAALGRPQMDVEGASLAEPGTSCAVVVVCTTGGKDRRAAGAAVIDDDPWRAFALAALQAVVALD